MKFPFLKFLEKEYPQFWITYCSHFKTKKKQTIKEARFVVLDTETTGFHFDDDRVLCIGAIGVKGNKILVNDGFEVYLEQSIFKAKTVRIHGILKLRKKQS